MSWFHCGIKNKRNLHSAQVCVVTEPGFMINLNEIVCAQLFRKLLEIPVTETLAGVYSKVDQFPLKSICFGFFVVIKTNMFLDLIVI